MKEHILAFGCEGIVPLLTAFAVPLLILALLGVFLLPLFGI